MSRKITRVVREEKSVLDHLEQEYRGKPQEIRVKMLQILKEYPECTMSGMGNMLGCSERSIRRWWTMYREEGIRALLEMGGVEEEKKEGLDEWDLKSIGRRIRSGEFNSLREVREWLRERQGILYSRSEIEYLLNVKAGVQPGSILQENNRNNYGAAVETPQFVIPEQMVNFLNALPLTNCTNDWINGFRKALLSILHDVDHIAINIRQTSNLTNPEMESSLVRAGITQHTALTEEVENRVVVRVNEERARHSERLLEEMRLQKRPLHKYQPPCCFDYYYQAKSYLGSIFLFRETGKNPLSEKTLATVDAMEPFFIYAFANHVKWYQETKSFEQVFQEGIGRLIEEGTLSAQEQKVAIFHMLGYSYEEIADLLCISMKTVKKHVHAIHHKTGTRRQRELFARYLSPRIHFASQNE